MFKVMYFLNYNCICLVIDTKERINNNHEWMIIKCILIISCQPILNSKSTNIFSLLSSKGCKLSFWGIIKKYMGIFCQFILISIENFYLVKKDLLEFRISCWNVMNKIVILKNDCTKYGYTFLIALWETWDMWGTIPDIELYGFCLHSGHPANEKIEKLFQNKLKLVC